MGNRSTFLLAVFIGLAMLSANCETAGHDGAAEQGTHAPDAPPPAEKDIPSGEPAMPPGPTNATNSVSDIVSRPSKLSGKSVTVVAEVGKVYDSRAFELNQGTSITNETGAKEASAQGPGVKNAGDKGASEGLLILIPKVGSFPGADDQWVGSKARVTGVVGEMGAKDIEREIGWELPPELASRVKGKPVLFARSVERFRK
jgi:hypothetical protein